MINRPNPNAKLWLFDFDNTLAALEREVDWPGSRRELEAFLRAEGVDEQIFVEIPHGNLPLYAALHGLWLRASNGETRLAIKQTANPSRAGAQALLRRSSQIIERHELIARGAISIIVTSNSSRTVARWLEIHRIAGLIRDIVGRDSLLALKPSPEMIARAIELVAIRPAKEVSATDFSAISAADTVFVGDSEADLGAARAAGLGFYGIAATESARLRLIAGGATSIFSSPAALLIHLNSRPDPHAEAD